jgi:hypothetical protein
MEICVPAQEYRIKNSGHIRGPKEQASYYQSLYASRKGYSHQNFENVTSINVPRLSDDNKQSCEGKLTIPKSQKAIKEMKNNKTPGNF